MRYLLIRYIYIAYIYCLLIALDSHIFSHIGYGPGTRAQAPKAAVLQALVLGPGPISIMADHMCIKGNQ